MRLDPVQVVESVVGRFTHGGQERFAGIVAHQAQELAQGQHDQFAAALLESGEVVADFRSGLQDELFFRVRVGTRTGGVGRWAATVMR
jgi:hypothetical protein